MDIKNYGKNVIERTLKFVNKFINYVNFRKKKGEKEKTNRLLRIMQ